MPDTQSLNIAVVGGGPGGYAAAFLAADLGMTVTLIDPELNPGGVCLYRGCIPSKALLHVAKLIEESEQAKNWGIDFAAPKIDLARLRSWKEGVVKKLTGGLGILCADACDGAIPISAAASGAATHFHFVVRILCSVCKTVGDQSFFPGASKRPAPSTIAPTPTQAGTFTCSRSLKLKWSPAMSPSCRSFVYVNPPYTSAAAPAAIKMIARPFSEFIELVCGPESRV